MRPTRKPTERRSIDACPFIACQSFYEGDQIAMKNIGSPIIAASEGV
jgi:hypothetical protein